MLRGLRRLDAEARANLIHAVATLVGVGAAAALGQGRGALWVAAALAGAAALACVAGAMQLRRVVGAAALRALVARAIGSAGAPGGGFGGAGGATSVLRLTLALAIFELFAHTLSFGDVAWAARLLPWEAVGFFGLIGRVLIATLLVPNAVAAAAYPELATAARPGPMLRAGLQSSLAAAVLIGAALWIGAPTLLRLAFPGDARALLPETVVALRLGVVYVAAAFPSVILSATCMARGHYRVLAAVHAAAVPVAFVLLELGARRWGLSGAVAAKGVTQLAISGVLAVWLWRRAAPVRPAPR